MNLMFIRIFRCTALIFLLSAALQATAAPGDPDPSFPASKPPECNSDGTSYNFGASLLPGADGSFFLSCRSTATELIVIKYSGRGTIDTRWGENGIARRQVPACTTCYSINAIEDYDGGVRLILPDGRSIRYRFDGKTDPGYGTAAADVAGLLGDSIVEPNAFTTFAIQHDGGMLALSAVPLPPAPNVYFSLDYDTLILRRLLPNGSRDMAFGNAGELRYRYLFTRGIDRGYGFGRISKPDMAGELVAWSLQPDKRLEVSFTTLSNANALQEPLQAVSLTVGALDPTATGRSFPAAGVGGWMNPEQRVLPDGSQLFARYEVTKWRPDGALDLAFGTRGSSGLGSCPNSPSLSLLAEGGIATYFANGGGFGNICGAAVTYLKTFNAAGFPNGGFGYVSGNTILIDRAGKLITVLNGGGGNLARYEGQGTRAEVTVIEYYHPLIDHYFMTATEQEIQDLDNTPASGWKRTGYKFGAWNIDTPMPGTAPVCRYYGDRIAGPNSHFHSAERFECDILAAQEAATPIGTRAWRLERDAFRITVPVNGQCPAALQPVHRLYNQPAVGKDPNHRYVTDPVEYQAMIAKGWLDDGVHMCATPNTGTQSARDAY